MTKLVKIADLVKEEGVNFTIVLLPYEFQLRDKNKSLPQDNMKAYLSATGLKVIDLQEILANNFEAPSSQELFLLGDGLHFSEKGHRLVYESLEKEFTQSDY